MARRSEELGSVCRLTRLRGRRALGRIGLIVAMALLGAGGCGKRVPHGHLPWAQVKAVVRVGSDPLPQGEVAFLADEGSGGVDAGGVVDARGTVTFPVLPGDYTVVIRPLPPSDEEMSRPRTGPNAARPRPAPIPGRFHSRKTSPLKATLAARETREFTFDLSAPDGQ